MPIYATIATADRFEEGFGYIRAYAMVGTWAVSEEEAIGIALKQAMESYKSESGYHSHMVKIPCLVPLDWLKEIIKFEEDYNQSGKLEEAVPESKCETGQGDSSPVDPVPTDVQQGTSE